MIVLAWVAALCLVLAPLGFVCDRWPSRSDDDRSVDQYARFLDELGGGR
jgi:hypothetical protein